MEFCDGSNACKCPAGHLLGVDRLSSPADGANHCFRGNTTAGCTGWNLEAANNFYLYGTPPPPGLVPLYRCAFGHPSQFGTVVVDHYTLTTDVRCVGGALEANLGFASPAAQCGAQALHGVTSGNLHHYCFAAEAESLVGLGWTDTGVVAYVWTSPD